MFNFFNAERRAKQKAWAGDVRRKAKIRRAQQAELRRQKEEVRRKQREEALNQRIKKLRQQRELYEAETGVYAARARRKKAKKSASPLRGLVKFPKKKKQGGKIKKRTRVQAF